MENILDFNKTAQKGEVEGEKRAPNEINHQQQEKTYFSYF